jgi:hypothetical protein
LTTLGKPELELGFVCFYLYTRDITELHLVPSVAWQCMKRLQLKLSLKLNPNLNSGLFFFALVDVVELQLVPSVIQ